MREARIRNIVGNVPEPDELYGRQGLLDHLWRQIRGNNVLLLAPRRFGKTGVMRHVLLRPQADYLPIYFDLEDVDSPAEFVWRLTGEILKQDRLRGLIQRIKGLPGQISGWLKRTFDEIEFEGAKVKFKEAIAGEWRTPARRLMAQLEKAQPTVVFILDELPAMLERMSSRKGGKDAANEFLSWFRAVRLQQKDRLRRHRFIVGGSIGIDPILRRLRASETLNDFERVYVEPLAAADADRLVCDLAASLEVGCDEPVRRRLLALIGPAVPYFIHLLFSQLALLPPGDRQPLAMESLERVYRERILGPTCRHYFEYYRQRLKRYRPGLERAAMNILRTVSESPLGRASWSQLFDVYQKGRKRGASELEFCELMADLQCDWYLSLDPNTNEYGFMLDVMRQWWQRWFGKPKTAISREVD
jgi:hypothetical protein